jgi:hypothetical protein
MYFHKVTWSPVEIEWLTINRLLPINQLSTALLKSRNAIMRQLNEIDGKTTPGSKNKNSIIGKRKDLGGLFMRSTWESNFCRFLNYHKIAWLYEPKVFVFDKVKRGTVSYLPDLYLPATDEYIEIKGQLTPKGRVAIKRLRQYYPEEFKKLRAVTASANTQASKFFKEMGVPILFYYNDLVKQYKNIIEHWE